MICLPWDDVAVVNYRIVDGGDEVAWLLAAARQDVLNTGLQGSGLEARGPSLHGMWMQPQGEGPASFDSAQRRPSPRVRSSPSGEPAASELHRGPEVWG